MKKYLLSVSFMALLLAAFSGTAAAGDPAGKIAVLEKKLAERDKVILELLERVEALEKRTGISRRTARKIPSENGEQSPQKTASKDAGPSGPGRIVVEKDAEERALDRALVTDGSLLLKSGSMEIEPRLIYSLKEAASPGLIASGGSVTASSIERDSHNVVWDLSARYGLPWDAQLEFGIPYQWRNVETKTRVGFSALSDANRSGHALGDLRVGIAKTLLRESLWRPDLIARITWDTNTGEKSDNGVSLSGGYHDIRGSLTAVKRQDPLAFTAGLSYEHSFESAGIQPGESISGSLGSYLAVSPETSLHALFSLSHTAQTRYNGIEADGTDLLAGTLSFGGSTLIGPGKLMNMSLGIGLTDDADDLSVSLSFPLRMK